MTDTPDTNDHTQYPNSHRWGKGWEIHNRNAVVQLINNDVIGSPEEYDHFGSFEEMAAFILGRGPYLEQSGFQPTQQDWTHINTDAPASINWDQLSETYECLTESPN